MALYELAWFQRRTELRRAVRAGRMAPEALPAQYAGIEPPELDRTALDSLLAWIPPWCEGMCAYGCRPFCGPMPTEVCTLLRQQKRRQKRRQKRKLRQQKRLEQRLNAKRQRVQRAAQPVQSP